MAGQRAGLAARAATPAGADVDAWFDVKVIYQQDHTSVDIAPCPRCSSRRSGRSSSPTTRRSTPPIPAADIFELRGIDRGGVVVVVRPDQYVANVLPLTATAELAAFFAQHLLARDRASDRAALAGYGLALIVAAGGMIAASVAALLLARTNYRAEPKSETDHAVA